MYHFNWNGIGWWRRIIDDASMLNTVITVITRDAYGNEKKETIKDNNPYVVSTSIVNIRMKAEKICISLPEDSQGTEISLLESQKKYSC